MKHQQFNIQQLYALPTLYLCFVFIWEQTATCATYSINWLVYITEINSVYCAVRTGSLNKAVCASYLKTHKRAVYNCFIIVYTPFMCFNSFWSDDDLLLLKLVVAVNSTDSIVVLTVLYSSNLRVTQREDKLKVIILSDKYRSLLPGDIPPHF